MSVPAWWHREICVGDTGDDVLIVQHKLGAPMTGVWDSDTMTRVRGFQRKHKLKETGTMTRETAAKAGPKASAGHTPEWFERELDEGDVGADVDALRVALSQPNLPVYMDTALCDAVRRFQAKVGIKPTGRLDKKTAIALADRTA